MSVPTSTVLSLEAQSFRRLAALLLAPAVAHLGGFANTPPPVASAIACILLKATLAIPLRWQAAGLATLAVESQLSPMDPDPAHLHQGNEHPCYFDVFAPNHLHK